MSRWSDVVDLIHEPSGVDDQGFPIDGIPIERLNIYANKKGIRSAEFYQASQEGYALEAMFEIRSAEYSNEELLRFNGTEYIIVRTYDRGEITELICMNGSNRKMR